MPENKWSNENRLIYIAKIVDELLSSKNLNDVSTLDNLSRIQFLADKSDAFLELNKHNYIDVLE